MTSEKSKSLGSGGSMVARLKLKGIDWGYSGYLYVAIGQDACGIAQECTSAVATGE